jgi:hypothetical protein
MDKVLGVLNDMQIAGSFQKNTLSAMRLRQSWHNEPISTD